MGRGIAVALVSGFAFAMSGPFGKPLLEAGWSPAGVVLVRIWIAAIVTAVIVVMVIVTIVVFTMLIMWAPVVITPVIMRLPPVVVAPAAAVPVVTVIVAIANLQFDCRHQRDLRWDRVSV